MHVVGSSISAAAAAAGSHKPAWAQKPASSGGDALATGGPATEPVDQVTLSAAAQELSAHGNAANSRAHLARAWIAQPGIAQQSGLADMPFGKVVSGLIHGTLQAATATDVTDTGATGDAPAATGEEPSVIPAGDDAAPGTDSVDAGASTATGEEPPAAPAAGDTVPPADLSDAPAVDEGDTADLIAPVTGEIDTAQLIEELLDQNAASAEAI